MKKIWINKVRSFKSAEEFDIEYYQKIGPRKRLELMQILREMFYKIKPYKKNEGRKRLRRFVKIVQHKVKYCIIGAFAVAFYVRPR